MSRNLRRKPGIVAYQCNIGCQRSAFGQLKNTLQQVGCHRFAGDPMGICIRLSFGDHWGKVGGWYFIGLRDRVCNQLSAGQAHCHTGFVRTRDIGRIVHPQGRFER